MNRMILTSGTVAALLSFALVADAATLAAHRAFYELTEKRIDKSASISAIGGKLAYEITGSTCEGFTINYRIANRIAYPEGQVQIVDTQLSSFEAGDGLQLDMTQKQFIDGKLGSDSRTKVKKESVTAPAIGTITNAETKSFEVDAAAVFPTLFQAKLLDAAIAGETRMQALVFEGSEDEKPVRAIGFIGAKRPATGLPENAKAGEQLAWPVTISYYDVKATGDDQPLYQASFQMLENGVSTDLVLDYGSYALFGKLTSLEMLTPDDCK